MKTIKSVSTLDLYRSIQPKGGNAKTARQGYYKILDLSIENEQPSFIALWKLLENEEFRKFNEVLIDACIFEYEPVSNTTLSIENLIGCTVNVRASFIDYRNPSTRIHYCNWSIIENPSDEKPYPECDTVKSLQSSEGGVEVQIENDVLYQEEIQQMLDNYDLDNY